MAIALVAENRSRHVTMIRGIFIVLNLTLAVAANARAAHPPLLTDVQPRGLQIGGTTRVVVTGTGLDESLRLIFPSGAGVDSTVIRASGDRAVMHVRVEPDVVAGIYPVRLATDQGLSNPLSVGVDALPQIEFRDRLVALPVALHGRLQSNQVLHTQFVGRAGERMVIDVEAQRLGAELHPTLRLYSPSDRLIGVARPSQRIGGDARLDLELPSDGVYRLELQDIVFHTSDPNWFRLKLGQLTYADAVFPLAIPNDSATQVQLVSTNTNGVVRLNPPQIRDDFELSVGWPREVDGVATGATPRVHLSSLGINEWREDSAQAAADRLQPPLAINGRLLVAGEQDEFLIRVRPGAKLRVEVFAARWGSALDAVLLVSRADGTALARGDDQPGSVDPVVDLDVPLDCEQIRVRVASLLRQGGDDHVYRLSVRPRGPMPPSLVTDLDCLNLPAGGSQVVRVEINHHGDPRPIQLALPAALEHVVWLSPRRLELTNDEIGLLEFRAAETARGIFGTRVLASVMDASPMTSTRLLTGKFPGSDYQPAWRRELYISVNPAAPLQVVWSDDNGPRYLARGTSRPLGVRLLRSADSHQNVRFTLITSQRPPMREVDGRQVPDTERTLRLLEEVTTQGKDANRREVVLHVPSDLALHDWSYAIKAELLGSTADEIEAVAYTPLRRWPTIAPLDISIQVDDKISVKAGDATGYRIQGRVDRHPDFSGPVAVRLEGLADVDAPPPAMLAVDQSDFEIVLKFDKKTPARELSGVRMVAELARPNALDPSAKITAAAEFSIEILAADEP